MRYFARLILSLSLVLAIYGTPAFAQTTATANEKAIGTACSLGAAGADFDVLAQCTSTSSTTGTMQKAPLFVGALTSPPYTSTTCDSTKAGMLQYTGGAFVGCNGTSWGSLPTTSVLGSSATLTGPGRSGESTTGLFSPATGSVAISAAGVEALRVTATGSLGVGTTTPGYTLETNGTAKIRSTVGWVPLYLAYSTYSASPWRVGPETSNAFVVYNSSSIGVYMLNGTTSWTANSDMRLKKNITPYSILDKIDSYRAVSFDWKGSGRHEVGVIAQEVYPLFPEIVNKGDDDPSRTVSMGGKNAWGVAYDRLGALSMQGVKELYSLVKELKAENEVLRTSEMELRARIEKLEAKLQ